MLQRSQGIFVKPRKCVTGYVWALLWTCRCHSGGTDEHPERMMPGRKRKPFSLPIDACMVFTFCQSNIMYPDQLLFMGRSRGDVLLGQCSMFLVSLPVYFTGYPVKYHVEHDRLHH